MKFFVLLISFIFSLSCFGQASPAVIYQQGYGKIIPQIGLRFADLKTVISGSADPSSVATDAPIGSLYISSNGKTYQKQDNGSSTNWSPLYFIPSFTDDNRLVKTDGAEDIQQTGITVDDSNNVSGAVNLSYGGSFFTPLTTGRVTVIDPTSALTVSTVTTAELEAFGGDIAGKLDKFPSETNDNRIARTDGDGGALQGSLVSIDDSGVVSGATQLNVDDLRLDGNTISSTTFATDLNITAAGDNVNVLKTLNTQDIVVDTGLTATIDNVLISANDITTTSGDLTIGATANLIFDGITANQIPFADNAGHIQGSNDFLYSSSLNKFRAGGVDIEGSSIIPALPNSDLLAKGNGTGKFLADEIAIKEQTISGTVEDKDFTLDVLGTGKYVFRRDNEVFADIAPSGIRIIGDTQTVSVTDSGLLSTGSVEVSPANGYDSIARLDGQTYSQNPQYTNTLNLMSNPSFENTDLNHVTATGAILTRVSPLESGNNNKRSLAIVADDDDWTVTFEAESSSMSMGRFEGLFKSQFANVTLKYVVDGLTYFETTLPENKPVWISENVPLGLAPIIELSGSNILDQVIVDDLFVGAPQKGFGEGLFYKQEIIELVNAGAQNANGTVKVTRQGNVVNVEWGLFSHDSASNVTIPLVLPEWASKPQANVHNVTRINQSGGTIKTEWSYSPFSNTLNFNYYDTNQSGLTPINATDNGSGGGFSYSVEESKAQTFSQNVGKSYLAAYLSSSYNIPTAETYLKLALNPSESDNVSVSSNEFTIEKSGWYCLQGFSNISIGTSGAGSSSNVRMVLNINGARRLGSVASVVVQDDYRGNVRDTSYVNYCGFLQRGSVVFGEVYATSLSAAPEVNASAGTLLTIKPMLNPNGETIPAALEENRNISSLPVTLSASSQQSTFNIEAASGTVNIGAGHTQGTKITVRKLHSGTGTITINMPSGETVTRAALDEVTLTSDGDFWTFHKVSSTRWNLIGGTEQISNANGLAIKNYDGSMTATFRESSATNRVFISSGAIYTTDADVTFTYPVAFSSVPRFITVADTSWTSSRKWAASNVPASTTVTPAIRSYSTGSASPQVTQFSYIAEGFWY